MSVVDNHRPRAIHLGLAVSQLKHDRPQLRVHRKVLQRLIEGKGMLEVRVAGHGHPSAPCVESLREWLAVEHAIDVAVGGCTSRDQLCLV
jgi:hypothetical protein